MGSHSLTPGDLPDPGIEPGSPALQADSLPSEPPGKPIYSLLVLIPRASLIAQSVKNLPAMQETQVRFLVQENSLEKEMVIHSSILA